MNRKYTNRILVFIGAAILFLILAYGFVPEVLSGKIVNQSDFSGWRGMAQETLQHNSQHPDDPTYWTNSMFGGMPNVSMYDDFKGDWTKPLYELLMSGSRPANYLFVSLLGSFLLMLSMGVNWLLAIGGAIAVTFCSYNLQIIQVGHNTKMQAIAFMPWVLAALIFTYKSALGKSDGSSSWKSWLPATLLGSVLFALALSMQIKANHPQITYYLAIIIFIYAAVMLVSVCVRQKEKAARFFIASAMLLTIGGVGIATNLNKLIPTYKYTPYTMRGGSELTPATEHDNDEGLDLDYATAWSYGIEETPNLLIPNFNGGSSAGEMTIRDSETEDLLRQAGQPNLKEVMKALPLYWGPQPFTAGPMYLGAISVFLFVLGLCLYDRKEKWWLLAATVLAVLLAWGSHFMWFTKLWFEYAPLYNKFRTVSMALTILQVTVPMLGFLVIDRILRGDFGRREASRATAVAFAVTGGFCLLFWIFPSLAGTFTGASDAGQPDILAQALADDRRAMLAKDAGRSFIFILLACALIFWIIRKLPENPASGPAASAGKPWLNRSALVSLGIVLLVAMDLLPVDKRYLDKDDFVSKRDYSGQFALRPVDKMILEDPDMDYRVLDISVNTFNDSHPSYYHKCIGGYSPAKLQRYQDLIENYLTPEINSIIRTVNSSATVQEVEDSLPSLPVISALNGKYIVLGEDYPPVTNRNAMGNCWFVGSTVPAGTPDDEIALIGKTDLKNNVVIGNDFSWARDRLDSLSRIAKYDIAPADSIWMTSYAPNELRYKYRSASEQAVVFSEIYYPEGWHAEVDGKPADIFRADWILRGIFVPAGEHEIVMRFDPPSYAVGERLSRASSITLIILLLLSCAGMAERSYKRRGHLFR